MLRTVISYNDIVRNLTVKGKGERFTDVMLETSMTFTMLYNGIYIYHVYYMQQNKQKSVSLCSSFTYYFNGVKA